MGKLSQPTPMRDRLKELTQFVSQNSDETQKTKQSIKTSGGSVSTRKQKRKAERKMVKMRKNAFKQGKELPTLASVEREKRLREEEAQTAVRAEKRRLKNSSKRRKKKQRRQRKAEEEKLALMEANKVEDREIKTCEKLLRLNKRKSKSISQGFKNDGLDFLLEAVDPEYLQSMYENGEEQTVTESILNMEKDSSGTDQSGASDFSDSDDQSSDANSSDEYSSYETKLLSPNEPMKNNTKGILKHVARGDKSSSVSSEGKSLRFEMDETERGDSVLSVPRETGDETERGDSVPSVPRETGDDGNNTLNTGKRNKRQQTREQTEAGNTLQRKRVKRDGTEETQSEGQTSDGETDQKRSSNSDKAKVKERKNKVKAKVAQVSKKSAVSVKNKSDKQKEKTDLKGKKGHKYVSESQDSSEEVDCSNILESDTSTALGTRVLEVKGHKETLDDSLDYLYGMEDSFSDQKESSDFPSSAMENSLTLTSEGESVEEGIMSMDNVAMETGSNSAHEDSDLENSDFKDSDLDDSDLEDSDLDDSDHDDDDLDDGDLESDLGEDEGDSESGPEYTEDIYGRLRDKAGNVVVEKRSLQKSSGAYVPPAKRLEGLSDRKKAEVERMRKQLKGLLNRVSESNMQHVANQVEEMFRSHSRADSTEALTDLMLGACIASYTVPERLVMEQCMLLSVLHHNIGSEVGGMFLQSVVTQFSDYFSNPGDGKEIHNLVTVISHLYNFKVVHGLLIFDILKKFTDRFGESDIEVLLVILKTVGFTLRKEDPNSLKEFIVNVQSVASSVNTEKFTDRSRVQFMLDIILHIKNNNMRKIPNYDPSHLDHLRKVIRNHVRGGLYGASQLRVSLADLLQAEERGKWWLVGSAWSGREDRQDGNTDSVGPVSLPGVSDKLLELAHKQRMNTAVRRHIFCVVMGCEDFVDGFEKLLRLGLKHQQEREIVHVLADLCLQEKTFNPFYALIIQKFCEYHRRFQMTLQFHLWDRFKELTSMSKVKLEHLSKLMTHLLATGALSLSVFKVLEFAELDKYKMTLIRLTLTSLLLDYEESVTQKVFLRIAPLSNLESLREGLSVFMKHFICRKKRTDGQEVKQESLNLLKQRVNMADQCLNTTNQVKM